MPSQKKRFRTKSHVFPTPQRARSWASRIAVACMFIRLEYTDLRLLSRAPFPQLPVSELISCSFFSGTSSSPAAGYPLQSPTGRQGASWSLGSVPTRCRGPPCRCRDIQSTQSGSGTGGLGLTHGHREGRSRLSTTGLFLGSPTGVLVCSGQNQGPAGTADSGGSRHVVCHPRLQCGSSQMSRLDWGLPFEQIMQTSAGSASVLDVSIESGSV
jgi:hypothetical protein